MRGHPTGRARADHDRVVHAREISLGLRRRTLDQSEQMHAEY
jgi:hypothetical protein